MNSLLNGFSIDQRDAIIKALRKTEAECQNWLEYYGLRTTPTASPETKAIIEAWRNELHDVQVILSKILS